MSTVQWIFACTLPAGFGLAWALTAGMRRYAISARLMDHPNERSSHVMPTPRGGGVAFVVSLLSLVIMLSLYGLMERRLATAMLGAGLLVAALGFVDDRLGLPARWRFLGHSVAAAWVLGWMGPVPAVPILGVMFNLSYGGPLLCGLFLVWTINLFNFMDGIDGIASVEAITTALGGALVWSLEGSDHGWMAAVVFACCVSGFLAWNFPPAKIFMGDVGSSFLGLMVALFALWSGQTTPALFWGWFILIGCFMVDATTTLVRRVRRGERFHEAHRSHAYQCASRVHGSHRAVTLAVAVINIAWLLPIAVVVALRHLDGVVGVIIAYGPLIWLAFRYKAGDRRAQEMPVTPGDGGQAPQVELH